MSVFIDPAPWLLGALCLHVLPPLALMADALTRPRPIDAPSPAKDVLYGRTSHQLKGDVRAFTVFYALSAGLLASAAVCSLLRHAPHPQTVTFTVLAVLTGLGAYAWHTPGKSTPAEQPATEATKPDVGDDPPAS